MKVLVQSFDGFTLQNKAATTAEFAFFLNIFIFRQKFFSFVQGLM